MWSVLIQRHPVVPVTAGAVVRAATLSTMLNVSMMRSGVAMRSVATAAGVLSAEGDVPAKLQEEFQRELLLPALCFQIKLPV